MRDNKTLAAAVLVCLAGCSSPTEKPKDGNNSNNGTIGLTTNNTTVGNNGTNNGTTVSNNDTTSVNHTNGLVPGVLDLLLVVDNSGSMCEEQLELGASGVSLAQRLAAAGTDFHIGVTTTHMNADYALEPVARPGELQSTPQPVPGFDRSCYDDIRALIDAAVDCMESPDTSYASVSDADIECALYGNPQGCSIASAGCGGGADSCTAEDLFPPSSAYRAIPKVLTSADYGMGDGLDIERFAADFACMTLVGARGYGIEKGLAAAVEAVSVAKTGGAVGSASANTSAPNHGLIRENSNVGVFFFTDENDCSHDGTLDESSACGGDVCEFANSEDLTDSPLIDAGVLAAEFQSNVYATKGNAEGRIVAASIHGNPKRYDGPQLTQEECSNSDGISPTCETSLGSAYSGDRYSRFITDFGAGAFLGAESGLMCAGDLGTSIGSVADFFAAF